MGTSSIVPFVQVQGVQKSFDSRQILSDIDMNVKEGEFVAIVGRSGCGKSTLLRLIAGLEAPSGGSMLLNNLPIDGTAAETRFLFQESRLLSWKTVLDNVRLGIPDRNKKQARLALQQVGLADREKDWPSVLSGGQKQRVALARALASHPRLLLLDEPLGALDALTRIEMQQLIERLWVEDGLTIILVTHDVSEAVALADRVLLIEDGEISMDTRITLERPRVRDSGFAHFENLILNRLLTRSEDESAVLAKQQLSFSI
ncbi:Aliphatic sulfonates import ATP-binding protein SsuB [compost metagenome]